QVPPLVGVQVRARADVHAPVEHRHPLGRVEVVPHHGPPRATDQHRAYLDRREPVDVDVHDAAAGQPYGQVGHTGPAGAEPIGLLHEDEPVGVAGRERLLHQDVLAGPQCGQGHVPVGTGRGGDRDRVYRRIVQDVGEPVGGRDRGVPPEGAFGATAIQVTQ